MSLRKSLICGWILLFDFFSHIHLFLFMAENHHNATSGFINVSGETWKLIPGYLCASRKHLKGFEGKLNPEGNKPWFT